MNAILVADLHLTSVVRDAYRWRLFPWLREQLAMHQACLVILGDLTEAKDYHSSTLVNRIVDELAALKAGVWIVPGNHDSIDHKLPYFRFLRHHNFITYHETPFLGPFLGRNALFLPHSKDFAGWDDKLLYDAEVVFMHQTVSGAKSETGFSLEGMAADKLRGARKAKIWSGDVHVPQVVGQVEYVGSPYPVRFGDKFKPRAVLLTKGMRQVQDLETPRFGRHSIKVFSDLTSITGMPVMLPGDQAKFVVQLRRSEFGEWERIRKEITKTCTDSGVELCGLEVERIDEGKVQKIQKRGEGKLIVKSPAQILGEWCAGQKLEQPIVDAGLEILRTVAK